MPAVVSTWHRLGCHQCPAASPWPVLVHSRLQHDDQGTWNTGCHQRHTRHHRQRSSPAWPPHRCRHYRHSRSPCYSHHHHQHRHQLQLRHQHQRPLQRQHQHQRQHQQHQQHHRLRHLFPLQHPPRHHYSRSRICIHRRQRHRAWGSSRYSSHHHTHSCHTRRHWCRRQRQRHRHSHRHRQHVAPVSSRPAGYRVPPGCGALSVVAPSRA